MRMFLPFFVSTVVLFEIHGFNFDFQESLLKEEKVSYYGSLDLSHELEGLLVQPRIQSVISKMPTIILFHHFMGRDNFTNTQAREIAKMGYIVFAADTYGKNMASTNVDMNFETMADVLSKRSTVLRDRTLAAWKYVNSLSFVDKNRIGTVGYCYGGLVSLDLARFDVGAKVAVSFHGTLTNFPENQKSPTRTIIQAHHGDLDIHTNETQVTAFLNEMRKRKANWHFIRYADAEHAFTVKGVEEYRIPGAKYNKAAAKRSWEYMKMILEDEL